jgi:hypothetical protein
MNELKDELHNCYTDMKNINNVIFDILNNLAIMNSVSFKNFNYPNNQSNFIMPDFNYDEIMNYNINPYGLIKAFQNFNSRFKMENKK